MAFSMVQGSSLRGPEWVKLFILSFVSAGNFCSRHAQCDRYDHIYKCITDRRICVHQEAIDDKACRPYDHIGQK